MHKRKSHLKALLLALPLWAAGPVPLQAEEQPIVIGASLPLSGVQADAGREGQAVMQAYVDAVNRQGGIGGRPLQLKVLDDGYEPQRAAGNARQLIHGGAVALLSCWGSASCGAMQPVLQEAQIPLVGALAGTGPVRQPQGRYTYLLRASTLSEISAMVQQMQTLGQNRIAVAYQQDSFGQNSLETARAVLGSHSLQPLAEIALEPSGGNAAAAAAQLARQPQLQGVIVLAGAPATVGLITAARQAQVGVQFYNLAAQAHQGVVKGLGEHTRGVIFTTLVPSPWRTALAVSKDYQQLLGAAGKHSASYMGMEVYLNVRTLVDGLRKAGSGVTRASLAAALDSLGEMHYGPMNIRFASGRHQGSNYVGLAMLNQQGHFID